jgi:ABC-type uncharacterized transport system auxiliary subunit
MSDGLLSSVWTGKHKRGWLLRALVGVLALLVSAACGGLPATHFYTLQLPPPPEGSDAKTSYVLGVDRFQASEALRDDRIVYFETPTQLNFYQYHRWASDPAGMLEELAIRKLDRAAVFAEVRRLPSGARADYTLRGRVLNFEEVDDEAGVHGRVGLELNLIRASDGATAWSDTRLVERPAEGKGVAGVVNALSGSSDQLMNELLAGLIAQVESEFARSSGQSHSQ